MPPAARWRGGRCLTSSGAYNTRTTATEGRRQRHAGHVGHVALPHTCGYRRVRYVMRNECCAPRAFTSLPRCRVAGAKACYVVMVMLTRRRVPRFARVVAAFAAPPATPLRACRAVHAPVAVMSGGGGYRGYVAMRCYVTACCMSVTMLGGDGYGKSASVEGRRARARERRRRQVLAARHTQRALHARLPVATRRRRLRLIMNDSADAMSRLPIDIARRSYMRTCAAAVQA